MTALSMWYLPTMYVCVHVCMCVFACVFACVCVCVCAFACVCTWACNSGFRVDNGGIHKKRKVELQTNCGNSVLHACALLDGP